MIRINVLGEREKNIDAARQAIRARSFTGRNPQLGPMINCQVCLLRHREIIKCQPKYAVGRWDPDAKLLVAADTVRGILGAQRFAKKRFKPHPNKRNLQLVQLTQQLYPEHAQNLTVPKEIMESARRQAREILKKKEEAASKIKRQQQQVARRINFGLLPPGSRP